MGADWVVVAAGPWSPELTASADVSLDVQPRRGQLVALTSDAAPLRHMLTHRTYYLVPKPDGSVVAGSTEEEQGFDARATVAGVRELLELTCRLVPSAQSWGIARVWAGIRPYTPSGIPEIGQAPGYENLVIATGHHRDGILLAPITAEIVAAGVAGSWRSIV
jgi:glycine oxidase